MKLLYLALITLAVNAVDPIVDFAGLIGKGNIHELAKSFAPTVELTINDATNTYSKAQAELVLAEFFNQNKPISSTMLHKINSGTNFRLGVVILKTDKGPFRAAFTLKEIDGSLKLIELRLETEKVR